MIRFSSPTSGDVQMLDAHARQLLDVIGKSAGERGVISSGEIPGALSALRSAIAQDAPQHAREEDADDGAQQAGGQRAGNDGLRAQGHDLLAPCRERRVEGEPLA